MMKPRKKRLTSMLSMYIDNELSPAERLEVDRYLLESGEARRQLDELMRIKNALGNLEPLPSNPFFYDDLYRRLPRPVFAEVREPLFPRKFIPAFAGMGAFAVMVLVVFASLKSDFLVNFFSKTTKDVQQAYEENVVKGWIMPLFQKTDRDDALQYAMFGILPLDDSSNTILRVDNTVEKGYTFELGQSNQPRYNPVTVEDLYREVKPTEAQRQILDTIFYLASKQIEEGVLLDENEQLAISPSVIDLQRTLIAKVAASLDSDRRARMEDFLGARNAYYAVRATSAPPVPRNTLVRQLDKHGESNTFVMISRDTILLSEITLDRKQLRAQMEREVASRRRLNIQFEKLAENLAQRFESRTSAGGEQREHMVTASAPVIVGSGDLGMRVHITIEGGPAQGFVASFVERRREPEPRVRWAGRNNVLAPSAPGHPQVRTVIQMEYQMDSMLSVQEEALRSMEKQLERMDNRRFQLHFDQGNLFLNLDSLERILRMTTDSMRIELRKMPGIRVNPAPPAPATPPGVEIRPDYYEEEQRQRNDGDRGFMIDNYKERLRKYQSQHDYMRRITSGSGTPRTSTQAPPSSSKAQSKK